MAAIYRVGEKKPSSKWFERRHNAGVHVVITRGRPGERGGRRISAYGAEQAQLARALVDAGLGLGSDVCTQAAYVLTLWGNGVLDLPARQVNLLLVSVLAPTRQPKYATREIAEVIADLAGVSRVSTARPAADWFVRSMTSTARPEPPPATEWPRERSLTVPNRGELLPAQLTIGRNECRATDEMRRQLAEICTSLRAGPVPIRFELRTLMLILELRAAAFQQLTAGDLSPGQLDKARSLYVELVSVWEVGWDAFVALTGGLLARYLSVSWARERADVMLPLVALICLLTEEPLARVTENRAGRQAADSRTSVGF